MSSYQRELQCLPVTAATRARGFRDDINGLRAWAVMAVVGYHFGILGVKGGFVGVDVFFVISGYLMSSIICTGLQSGNFSIRQLLDPALLPGEGTANPACAHRSGGRSAGRGLVHHDA